MARKKLKKKGAARQGAVSKEKMSKKSHLNHQLKMKRKPLLSLF